MTNKKTHGLLALAALVLLGGCATATRPVNPPITEVQPEHRLPLRGSPGTAVERKGEPGHPRVLGRRHARRGVFLRRPRIPAPHRSDRSEGQQGQPARLGRRHHRSVGRQLHCAGLRPLRRQAVRRIRAAFPEAGCAGRDRFPQLQSVLLGQAEYDGLGPIGARGGALRRDPVRRRHVRRSQPGQGTAYPRLRHRHLHRVALRLQPGRLRYHLLGLERGARCPAPRPRRRPCRSCSRPSR